MSKLKNVRVLTTCAMLLALATILGFFKIPVNSFIEIRFGSIPIALAGYLFGPAVGGIVGGVADILQYIVKPTGAYFPGFTISAAVSGIIFGLCFNVGRKGRDISVLETVIRVFISEVLFTLICSLLINTLNLSILYGSAFWPTLLVRLPKSLVMMVVNTALISLVLVPSQKVAKQVLNF